MFKKYVDTGKRGELRVILRNVILTVAFLFEQSCGVPKSHKETLKL